MLSYCIDNRKTPDLSQTEIPVFYFFCPGNSPLNKHPCLLVAVRQGFVALLYNHTFLLLSWQKYFVASPKKIGISQYSFLSKLYFISQHRCVIANPGKGLCAAPGLADFQHPDVTLASGLVPHTIGDLFLPMNWDN